MPSEAQLKAQMQAAIAKKKQEAVAKAAAKKTVPAKEPETVTEAVPEVVAEVMPEAVPEVTPEPPAEPVVVQTTAVTQHNVVVTPTTPAINGNTPLLTFYNQPIRYKVEKQQVYFAIPDVLPLSYDHECHYKYLELRNNPATQDKVTPLVKSLHFGSDKMDGATSTNLLMLLRELKLKVPGPFGRWLFEVSEEHKNDEEKT